MDRDLDFLNLYMVLHLILLGRLVSCTTIIHLFSGNMLNNSIIIYIQDKANPFATVLSAAMLLRYGLGEEKAAQRIENAVLDTLNKGFRTSDIYSSGTVNIPLNILTSVLKNFSSFFISEISVLFNCTETICYTLIN